MRELPHNPRPHSIRDLDRRIAEAEKARDRHRVGAEGIDEAGGDSSRVRAMMQLAEERLAQLRRSRETLLHGEGLEDDEAAETNA